jgi:hypothetical protein
VTNQHKLQTLTPPTSTHNLYAVVDGDRTGPSVNTRGQHDMKRSSPLAPIWTSESDAQGIKDDSKNEDVGHKIESSNAFQVAYVSPYPSRYPPSHTSTVTSNDQNHSNYYQSPHNHFEGSHGSHFGAPYPSSSLSSIPACSCCLNASTETSNQIFPYNATKISSPATEQNQHQQQQLMEGRSLSTLSHNKGDGDLKVLLDKVRIKIAATDLHLSHLIALFKITSHFISVKSGKR